MGEYSARKLRSPGLGPPGHDNDNDAYVPGSPGHDYDNDASVPGSPGHDYDNDASVPGPPPDRGSRAELRGAPGQLRRVSPAGEPGLPGLGGREDVCSARGGGGHPAGLALMIH